jgi:tripartite-type tricarboxylate transporter receptor subunit TctC
LKEVLDEAKRKPDTIQEATNIGAIIHFTSLALMDATGAKLRLVHMGDGAQRITSVLGGHVEITIMGTQEALPYYQSKEMKVLAVTSSKRLPGMEDVPTAVEQGINVVQPNDYWFFMPKGSPKDRVGFMTNALEQVMKDQEIISRMLSLSMEPSFMAGDELAKHIAEREEMLVEIAKKYNLVQ